MISSFDPAWLVKVTYPSFPRPRSSFLLVLLNASLIALIIAYPWLRWKSFDSNKSLGAVDYSWSSIVL